MKRKQSITKIQRQHVWLILYVVCCVPADMEKSLGRRTSVVFRTLDRLSASKWKVLLLCWPELSPCTVHPFHSPHLWCLALWTVCLDHQDFRHVCWPHHWCTVCAVYLDHQDFWHARLLVPCTVCVCACVCDMYLNHQAPELPYLCWMPRWQRLLMVLLLISLTKYASIHMFELIFCLHWSLVMAQCGQPVY